MARVIPRPKPSSTLPATLLADVEARRAGIARHMARAVVTLVRWDDSTGAPPRASGIARACEAGLDLFLATAREGRAATPEEMRRVAQLGILQARGSQSVEPILSAYRIAARVAWDAILRAWRQHPEATAEATAEAMVFTANYVFSALDQVAAEVTRTFLHAREQHLMRGTRARTRVFHALISDTFDSELALQKQALSVNLPLASGYVAVVTRLLTGQNESERGGETLAEMLTRLELPAGAVAHVTDPNTLVILWPAESPAALEGGRALVAQIQEAVDVRLGHDRAKVRAAFGSYHPGLRGTSRSYLEAQQAIELGRKLRPDGRLYHFDELAPYLVLSQNPLVAEHYVEHVLGRLIKADASSRASLLETLDAYLVKGSVKEAAALLKLHRHTVLYRLAKIRDLLEGDLDEPGLRNQLQLALDLRRLL